MRFVEMTDCKLSVLK